MSRPLPRFTEAEWAARIRETRKMPHAEDRRRAMGHDFDDLPERERRILEARVGLNGEPLTRRAIGEELGLTQERIRQLEKWTIRRLAR